MDEDDENRDKQQEQNEGTGGDWDWDQWNQNQGRGKGKGKGYKGNKGQTKENQKEEDTLPGRWATTMGTKYLEWTWTMGWIW